MDRTGEAVERLVEIAPRFKGGKSVDKAPDGRLRTLEQHVNSSDLPDDVKVKLQSYITGCYGSLTSFNVLFADEEDQFQGSGGD